MLEVNRQTRPSSGNPYLFGTLTLDPMSGILMDPGQPLSYIVVNFWTYLCSVLIFFGLDAFQLSCWKEIFLGLIWALEFWDRLGQAHPL